MSVQPRINPITTFAPHFFKMSKDEKKDRETDKRPQRDEHEKDEALEEFVDPNPNEKSEKRPNDPEEEGMGRSRKTKNQPSDERDRYMDDK